MREKNRFHGRSLHDNHHFKDEYIPTKQEQYQRIDKGLHAILGAFFECDYFTSEDIDLLYKKFRPFELALERKIQEKGLNQKWTNLEK